MHLRREQGLEETGGGFKPPPVPFSPAARNADPGFAFVLASVSDCRKLT